MKKEECQKLYKERMINDAADYYVDDSWFGECYNEGYKQALSEIKEKCKQITERIKIDEDDGYPNTDNTYSVIASIENYIREQEEKLLLIH